MVNPPTERQTRQVFVSYSEEDGSVAADLVEILQNDRSTWVHGWEVFSFLHTPLMAGTNFHREVLRRARTAGIVLLVWSRNSSTSDWVRREYVEALDGMRFVVPVRLDQTPLPRQLSKTQSVTAYGRPRSQWTEELLAQLRRLPDYARSKEGLCHSRNSSPGFDMFEDIGRWVRRQFL